MGWAPRRAQLMRWALGPALTDGFGRPRRVTDVLGAPDGRFRRPTHQLVGSARRQRLEPLGARLTDALGPSPAQTDGFGRSPRVTDALGAPKSRFRRPTHQLGTTPHRTRESDRPTPQLVAHHPQRVSDSRDRKSVV